MGGKIAGSQSAGVAKPISVEHPHSATASQITAATSRAMSSCSIYSPGVLSHAPQPTTPANITAACTLNIEPSPLRMTIAMLLVCAHPDGRDRHHAIHVE